MNKKRQIVLDIETTGMNSFGKFYEGHKIIEIGAVEIINRNITNNKYHTYINPNRSIDKKAYEIHGINNYFLKKKPYFKDIVNDFINFINNSELIIHNSNFDVSFINYELSLLNNRFFSDIRKFCKIVDSLNIAKKIFPEKRNNLTSLIKRYSLNVNRKLHGALLDANILAKIYLLMTVNQKYINFNSNENFIAKNNIKKKTKIIFSSNEENDIHIKHLKSIKNYNNNCLWLN